MKIDKKPNIIIINPDEMRWDTMGHMGNPAAYTPNLDRFAQNEAVSFSQAYCQNPVCVPSRCSFFTGLYPHVNGHRTMEYLQHEHEANLFTDLKAAGYHVWMNSRNDLVAAQIPGLVDSQADEIYYGEDNEQPKESGRERPELAKKFPFSHYGGHEADSNNQDMQDTLAAIKRIKTPIPEDKPLCLFLGWIDPHPPYLATSEFYERIDSAKMPPRARMSDTSGKSLILQRIHELANLDDFTEENWTEMRRVYLAQCAKVDAMFGMICDSLKEAGIYENTAIFFLSDHGDFCGDYDLPEKAQNTFEDCLTRVPLLIKPPANCKINPGVTGSMAELVDFYATAMDYAGVEIEREQFGRSLRPVIENRNAQVRSHVCAEGGRMASEWQADEAHSQNPGIKAYAKNAYWPKITAQTDPLAHEKGTMIYDGRFKYVERPSGRNELYDLHSDPQELRNIYPEHQNEPVVTNLRLQLLNWYQTTCDVVPKEIDSRLTPEKLWVLVRGMCPPDKQEWLKKQITENPSVNPFALMKMVFSQKGADANSEAAAYAGTDE